MLEVLGSVPSAARKGSQGEPLLRSLLDVALHIGLSLPSGVRESSACCRDIWLS